MWWSKFWGKNRGSVTVLLTLLLLPSMMFSAVVVDGARISAGKNAISGAGDMAMNAALASYDHVLKDMYGLFAMSTSPDELQANLEIYFENTLRGLAIDESEIDSYTQSFLNKIKASFTNPSNKTFDNLMDLQTEMFTVHTVENANLANPSMLKREILDFMKYRGPINVGMSFFTKFESFGQMSQQSKTVAQKIKFEQSLDDVGKAAAKAYKSIKEYMEEIKKIDDIPGELSAAEIDYKMINEMLFIMHANPFLEAHQLAANTSSPPASLTNPTSLQVPSEISHSSISTNYNFIHEANNYISVANDNAGSIIAIREHYNKLISDLNLQMPSAVHPDDENYETIEEERQRIQGLINTAQAELQNANSIAENSWKKAGEYHSQINSIIQSYGNAADNIGKDRGEILAEKLVNPLEKAIKESKNAVKQLNIVLDKAVEAMEIRNHWEESINELKGDVRTTMESQFQNTAKDFNSDEVKLLIEAIKGNQKYYEDVYEELKKSTYRDTTILKPGTNIASKHSGSVSNEINLNGQTSFGSIQSLANNKLLNTLVLNSGDSVSKENLVVLDPNEYKYLDYLMKTYKEEDKVSAKDKEASKQAKADRKALLETGDDKKVVEGDDNKLSKEKLDTEIFGDLPSTLAIIAQQEKLEYKKINTSEHNWWEFWNWGKDNENNADATFDSGTTFLGTFNNATKKGLEKAYIMEYAMGMFSHQLTGKDPDKEYTTMLGNPITEATNHFYRGEIEYLLWGQDSVFTNVAYTNTSIFTTRFILNSIYCLTSSDVALITRPAAIAIAGWSGFGIPIVKTVLDLSIALAETTLDMKDLVDGKQVPLYKSKQTFRLSLQNGLTELKNEVVDELVEEAKDIGNKAIDYLEDYTGELTQDKLDEIEVWIKRITESAAEYAMDAVTGPIEDMLLSVALDESISRSNISARVDKVFEDIRINLGITQHEPSDVTDVVAMAKYKVFQQLKILKPQIIEEIKTLRDIYVNDTSEINVVSEDLKKLVSDILLTARYGVDNFIDDTVSYHSNEIYDAISKVGDEGRKQLDNALDNFKKKLGSTNDVTGNTASSAIASGFDLGYTDYLRVFLYGNLLAGEDRENTILVRIGDLIQLNMIKSKQDFLMQEAHTHIQVNAQVSVRTTVAQIAMNSGSKSKFGNRYVINYKGILGY